MLSGRRILKLSLFNPALEAELVRIHEVLEDEAAAQDAAADMASAEAEDCRGRQCRCG